MDENYFEELEEKTEYKEIVFVLELAALKEIKSFTRKVGFKSPEELLTVTSTFYVDGIYLPYIERGCVPGLLEKDQTFTKLIIPGVNEPYISIKPSLSEEESQEIQRKKNYKELTILVEKEISEIFYEIADKTGSEGIAELIATSIYAYQELYGGYMERDAHPGYLELD